jgi:hypothetical protein
MMFSLYHIQTSKRLEHVGDFLTEEAALTFHNVWYAGQDFVVVEQGKPVFRREGGHTFTYGR